MKNEQQIITQTQHWLENFVIDLNLCPFARHVVNQHQLRYRVVEAQATQDLLMALSIELDWLNEHPETETTLLVHPYVLQDFDEYVEFLSIVDLFLEEGGFDGVYQVASFHPDYQFEGATAKDPANYTNRSPYPMLHILREASVSLAIDSHPNIDSVPDTNVELLRKLGLDDLRSRLQYLKIDM